MGIQGAIADTVAPEEHRSGASQKGACWLTGCGYTHSMPAIVTSPELTAQDWTLLVIGAVPGRDVEPVQLQKSLFLLSRNLSHAQLCVKSFYDFQPYDYGPFCSAVYEDAERLARDGLVNIARPPETRFNTYSVTETGAARAHALAAALPKPTFEYLRRVVMWTTSLSFTQLVTAIYRAFPDMKVNSVFAG